MTCTHPLIVKVNGLGMAVPCGRCIACRVSKTREWAVRLVNELEAHKCASFITLTYDPEHLPKDNGLQKRDLQLFWKRLRKEVNYDRLRYFACGEYGDKYGRPHYHAVLYGLGCDSSSNKLVSDAWGLGLTHSGNVTYQSARYVAQYCQKKLSGQMAENKYQGRQAPFALMSKGIGLDYALKNAESIQKNLCVKIDGKPVGLPRYYRKKIDIDLDKLTRKAIERQKEEEDFVRRRSKEHISDTGNLVNAIYELDDEIVDKSSKLSVAEYILEQRNQREINILARFSLTEDQF